MKGSWKGERAGSKAQVDESALRGNSSTATAEREGGYMCV